MDQSREKVENQKGHVSIESVGMFILIVALIGLFVAPGFIGGVFNAMFIKAKMIVSDVYLVGSLGATIICSVMMGRVLERLGLTDALVRVFAPIANKMGLNPTVIVPGVYNILGDINAAGRIAGPVLVKAGATKDEQKIAICTMVQSEQSFSTFMLGLIALTAAGVWAFPVIVVALFLPLIIVPWLLSKTIYRDVKRVSSADIPRFTPYTGFTQTVFGSAREGAELLFLLLIPAAAVIFAIIGALDYIGIWGPLESCLSAFLGAVSIHPETGILSIMAGPTIAMNVLKDVAATLDPKLVVGSFVLGASGFPLQVIFGQIPVVWAQGTDLTASEAMTAAVIGIVIRIITAILLAFLLTPLIS